MFSLVPHRQKADLSEKFCKVMMNYLFHQTFCKKNCLTSEKSAFQPAQRLCDQAPFSKASAKVETLFIPTKYF